MKSAFYNLKSITYKFICGFCGLFVTKKVALYKDSRAKLQKHKFQNFFRVIIFEIAGGVL
jgi:hypothetical protein